VEVAEFAKVMENPLKDMVMEGAAFARDNGCDFIVALGGGAVLDSATAISAMATNEGDLWDYVCGGTGKGKPLSRPGLPVVTITLTAGNQLLGRYFQSENSGKNRFWRSDAQSCSRHCGPGTDEDDSCALYGISGL
jgi:alcohol dehydrogenase YqhD (iron-dependent ADH family)